MSTAPSIKVTISISIHCPSCDACEIYIAKFLILTRMKDTRSEAKMTILSHSQNCFQKMVVNS